MSENGLSSRKTGSIWMNWEHISPLFLIQLLHMDKSMVILYGASIPVNEKLSEIFLQLHISEKTGRGVPRIVEKYGVDAFEFRQNSIVVNIPFNWINVMGDKVGDKKGYNSITSEEKILNAIRDNPSITKPEICKIVGLGKTSIDNYISKLKKKGMIKRIGSNKTGYWKVSN